MDFNEWLLRHSERIAELIYKYEYRPERIRFELKVPRRTPNDLADIVIYGDKDEELKAPYFVFECKAVWSSSMTGCGWLQNSKGCSKNIWTFIGDED